MNDRLIFWGVLGAAGVYAYWRHHRQPFGHQLPPAANPGRWADPRANGTWVAPTDAVRRMYQAWWRNGQPPDRDGFIAAMMTVEALPPRVWGAIYDRSLGLNGQWLSETETERLLTNAANGEIWA